MVKKVFNVGDLVLAKVKGYPAWPASRNEVNDFVVTPKWSLFSGMDKKELDRFCNRQWNNYFPVIM
jgi:hypothetical protein